MNHKRVKFDVNHQQQNSKNVLSCKSWSHIQLKSHNAQSKMAPGRPLYQRKPSHRSSLKQELLQKVFFHFGESSVKQSKHQYLITWLGHLCSGWKSDDTNSIKLRATIIININIISISLCQSYVTPTWRMPKMIYALYFVSFYCIFQKYIAWIYNLNFHGVSQTQFEQFYQNNLKALHNVFWDLCIVMQKCVLGFVFCDAKCVLGFESKCFWKSNPHCTLASRPNPTPDKLDFSPLYIATCTLHATCTLYSYSQTS